MNEFFTTITDFVGGLVQPYDFLSVVPVIEGAGGSITDWRGQAPLASYCRITAHKCNLHFPIINLFLLSLSPFNVASAQSGPLVSVIS